MENLHNIIEALNSLAPNADRLVPLVLSFAALIAIIVLSKKGGA
ncbi:hypothetical protein [Pseudomonas sp. NFPP19]|nr:hypothetical protein [Pseudomonas sp. NFPP19]